MKATPTRLPDGAGALVVPDASTGAELLLTETGHRALQTSLEHEGQATRIAGLGLWVGAAFTALGALSFAGPLTLAPLVPLAALSGWIWGRASFRRKLRRLGRGQIPRHAVLGGGRTELFWGGALFLGLLAVAPTPVALTLFFVAAAAAVGTYGRAGAGLAASVGAVFDPVTLETAAALPAPPDQLRILGQGSPEAGRCPVCGDGLGGVSSNVYCELCGTGHHPECWSYAGRCSVFGCRGEGVSTAGVDAALQDP